MLYKGDWLADTLGTCHRPRSKPQFPLLSERRAASCTKGNRKFPSPGKDVGVYVSSSQREQQSPGSRWTPTEAELGARRDPSELACAPCKASFLAPGLGWCAQPDKVSPPVPACRYLLPASPGGPSHSRLLRARGCVGSAGHAPCSRPESWKRNWAQRDHQLPGWSWASHWACFLTGKWKNTKCQVTFRSPALIPS